jgi:hypothetical protein
LATFALPVKEFFAMNASTIGLAFSQAGELLGESKDL